MIANQQPPGLRKLGKKKWGGKPEIEVKSAGVQGHGTEELSAQTILEQVWDGLPELCDDLESVPKREAISLDLDLAKRLDLAGEVPVRANRPEERVHAGRNPWAVNSFRDLLHHLGLWFYLLLAAQMGSAFWASQWVGEHTEFSWEWVYAGQLVFAVLANFIGYFSYRGKLCTQFLRPGLVLGALTVLPWLLVGFFHALRDLAYPG